MTLTEEVNDYIAEEHGWFEKFFGFAVPAIFYLILSIPTFVLDAFPFFLLQMALILTFSYFTMHSILCVTALFSVASFEAYKKENECIIVEIALWKGFTFFSFILLQYLYIAKASIDSFSNYASVLTGVFFISAAFGLLPVLIFEKIFSRFATNKPLKQKSTTATPVLLETEFPQRAPFEQDLMKLNELLAYINLENIQLSVEEHHHLTARTVRLKNMLAQAEKIREDSTDSKETAEKHIVETIDFLVRSLEGIITAYEYRLVADIAKQARIIQQ